MNVRGAAATYAMKQRTPRRAPGRVRAGVPLRALAALALAAGVALLLPRPLDGADGSEPPAEPVLPMVRAIGGAFTAVASDQNAVFANPAGYALVKDRVISVMSFGIRLNIDESALNLYEGILSGVDVSAPENVDEYFNSLTLTQGITGPFQIGRVGDNFGFVFYNNIDAKLLTHPGGTLPAAEFQSYSDLGLVGGYGFALPFLENLYAGFNMKVILRMKSALDGTIVDVVDAVSDADSVPVGKAVGLGGDLGLLYAPAPWCRLGLAAKDFFGTRFSWETVNGSGADFAPSYIKPRVPVGAAFYPLGAGGKGSKGFSNFIVAVEYSDLLDFSSFFSNVRFGASFDTLKFITLRLGFEGGYLAGGAGFDLKVTSIELAYFVYELGSYPGSSPAQNVMLNFALRW